MLHRALPAVVTAAALMALPGVASAGGPGSTTLLTRPDGFGTLVAPSVNNSTGWALARLASMPGTQSGAPRLASASGRYVAFVSDADGLAPDDGDSVTNVYVRDSVTQTTILVSRADGAAGAPADRDSDQPSMSSDGTHVAFHSYATNLAGPAIDTGGTDQIYVRDLVAGTTRLVSRATGGAGQIADSGADRPDISGDGLSVAFQSAATNLAAGSANDQIYVRKGTTTTLASAASGTTTPASSHAFNPSISDDGQDVAFSTFASLDVADGNNTDVYRRTLGTKLTVLVSRATNNGTVGNGDSSGASISGDGQQVAFTSYATNLDVNDTDPSPDVYLRDFSQGTSPTFLISRTGNTRGDAPSGGASINLTGTRVAFTTASTNLAGALDTNGVADVYVRALTGIIGTSLASRCLGGTLLDQPAGDGALSPNGSSVLFTTLSAGCSTQDDDDFSSVYTRWLGLSIGDPLSWVSRPSGTGDFRSGVNTAALHGFHRSLDTGAALSADGRSAAFFSTSDELSSADDNRFANVFVRDGLTGATTLVSRADGPDGAAANGASGPIGPGLSLGATPSAPSISADGRRVAFASRATNLVPGDNNGHMDVFVRDLVTGQTILASRATDGSQQPQNSNQPRLSADGTRVAFASSASFDPADGDVQSDVYVRDITSNTTFLASRQNGANGPGVNADAADPAISGDGNRVAFVTTGNNLLPSIFDPNGVSDVYVRDLAAGTTVVGSARTGAPAAGNGMSMSASLDATGTHLAFASAATDLAPGVDGNGTSDVFLRDLGASTTTLVSRGASTAAGNDTSLRPSISADAQRIAFESAATDLVPGDVDAATDVFVRDRAAATTTLVSRADGAAGAPAARGAGNASMSADGHCVAFDSDDDALVAGTVGSDFTRGYVRALDGICGAPPAQEPPAGADPGTGGGGGGGVGTPPGSGGPLADRTAPALSAVALSNRRFRVGGKATATIAAARRATAPTGTTIRFTLSEAATVTLSVERPLKGRMKGARCLTGRAAPSKGKRCTTYRAEGALRRGAAKGPKTVVFSGRIGRTALVTGAHRLTLLAIDAAGNRSPVKRIAFTIVRR